jgi:GH24 family phage-related lysozyme (muramidase)
MNWYENSKLAGTPLRKRLRDYGMGAGLGAGIGLSLSPAPYPARAQQIPVQQTIPTVNVQPYSGQADLAPAFSPSTQPSEALQQLQEREHVEPFPRQQEVTQPPASSLEETPEAIDLSSESLNLIKNHEGLELTAYEDSEGVPTIGYGFNLERKDAKSLLSNFGLDLDKVIAGEQSINQSQAEELLSITAEEAEQTARRLFPKINEHPKPIQIALTDMAFNLGPTRLNNFDKMQEALLDKDYNRVADEMVDSKWYGQTKRRAVRLVQMVRDAAKQTE